MATEINIRRGNSDDFARLGEIVHLAIHGSADRYTPSQKKAWSPEPRDAKAMSDRIGTAAVWVAETDDLVIGFMTLEGSGYVDFAYILADWQGRGVFRRLYEAIEFQAQTNEIKQLSTHASLQAYKAFGHFGFEVLYPETVEVSGAWLPRFYMEKRLVRR
ncbi:MAG: GNAT family N-acetyltransferase [Pseudomonadota bacterium]